MMLAKNSPPLFSRFERACIVAVAVGALLFFGGLMGLFMMIGPVGDFFSMTTRLLGIPDGGSFFYDVMFWTVVAFVVTLVLPRKRGDES